MGYWTGFLGFRTDFWELRQFWGSRAGFRDTDFWNSGQFWGGSRAGFWDPAQFFGTHPPPHSQTQPRLFFHPFIPPKPHGPSQIPKMPRKLHPPSSHPWGFFSPFVPFFGGILSQKSLFSQIYSRPLCISWESRSFSQRIPNPGIWNSREVFLGWIQLLPSL